MECASGITPAPEGTCRIHTTVKGKPHEGALMMVGAKIVMAQHMEHVGLHLGGKRERLSNSTCSVGYLQPITGYERVSRGVPVRCEAGAAWRGLFRVLWVGMAGTQSDRTVVVFGWAVLSQKWYSTRIQFASIRITASISTMRESRLLPFMIVKKGVKCSLSFYCGSSENAASRLQKDFAEFRKRKRWVFFLNDDTIQNFA